MNTEKYTGRVAAVVIPRTSSEEEFLVAKRNDNGDWEFPGGKQEHGETLIETAEREIEEEFKIEVKGQKCNEEFSWEGGGYQIVPVIADHDYEDLDEVIKKSNLADHSKVEYVKPENLGQNLEKAEEKLGKELNGLQAFNLL